MVSWLLLLVALVLMVVCGFFVAAEFSLVSVDRALVQNRADQGDAQAKGLLKVLSTLSTQLSGAQIGITVTNLAIGYLAQPALADLLRGPGGALGLHDDALDAVTLVVALVLSSLFTMILGELIPKNIALALPQRTAFVTGPALRVFSSVVRGPIAVLGGCANGIVRLLGVMPQEELHSARTTGELASLIEHSSQDGTLDADTATLMTKSVEFTSRTAGEIMTPRIRQHELKESDRAVAVIELAKATGHSRFPVLDDRGSVVGTVHVKSAVGVPAGERASTRIKHLMREPIFVPDSLRLDPLLEQLRSESFQLAIVLDEYGDQAGIVTLEDVVEEIVGDIADEHDPTGQRARLRRDGSWLLSGLLRPDEVEDLTGVDLPTSENYDTIAGLMLVLLGEIPSRGDRASIALPADDLDDDDKPTTRTAVLTVEHMDGLRIDRLTLRVSTRSDGDVVAKGERA